MSDHLVSREHVLRAARLKWILADLRKAVQVIVTFTSDQAWWCTGRKITSRMLAWAT